MSFSFRELRIAFLAFFIIYFTKYFGTRVRWYNALRKLTCSLWICHCNVRKAMRAKSYFLTNQSYAYHWLVLCIILEYGVLIHSVNSQNMREMRLRSDLQSHILFQNFYRRSNTVMMMNLNSLNNSHEFNLRNTENTSNITD